MLSSLARVSFMVRCLGPLWSAVMNGRLMSVSIDDGELALGLLGGLFQALQGHLVLRRSMPWSFLNSSAR